MKPLDLLRLDVGAHIEKKNGLSYLSWAWAWDQALRADPNANFHVESWTDDKGVTKCWMDVNGTAMVWVRVVLFGKSMTCMLPVMDHRNKPIQNPDAFQMNTAIMRCMTKALALHGLGLYIYAGEDLPEQVRVDDADTKEHKKEHKEPKKPEAPKEGRPEAELFAEGMVKFVTICETESGLRSYWKANQTQLDGLKANHPDLYDKVRTVFTDMKAKLTTENKDAV